MLRLAGVVLAALISLASATEASMLNGAWRGELAIGPTKIPLVFNFTESENGAIQCTLDSPNQGAKDIPATVLYSSADSVLLMCSSIGAMYGARIADGVIAGRFRQGPYSLPLTLAPEESGTHRRPQTPRPPYPYTMIDTTFASGDGAAMSGTLTLPAGYEGSERIPAVVMVTGSGPQNRDEELFEHRPFAVIADYLARRGIASLRYDDRGTAASGGNFASATIYTFEDDATAAIDLLRSLPEIGKVGVIGHSEGGTIGFMLGAEGKADFVVSLAGMAVSGKETVLAQNEYALLKAGVSGESAAACIRLLDIVFDRMADEYRRGVSEPIDADSIAAANGIAVGDGLMVSLRSALNSRSSWYDAFLGFDARRYLKDIKCPLLAINGDRDTQVAASNLDVVKALAANAQTYLAPGLNHLMQHATTGDVAEYAEIRETIVPEVLEAIADFILEIK